MAVKTYDPAKVKVIVDAFEMSGFADGAFITVSQNADAWSTQIGCDGEGSRSKSNDRSAQITLRLMQTSDSNTILSAKYKADDLLNAGAFTLMIKDGSSDETIHLAESAWIKKLPDAEYAREAGSREWVIETDNLQSFLSGTSS